MRNRLPEPGRAPMMEYACLPPARADHPKVVLYCHDSYGLGHLSRTLTLARYLQDEGATTSQLIVTGSPGPQNFSFLECVGYIKPPSVVKVQGEEYDLLLVDHAPAGLEGEIVPALGYLVYDLILVYGEQEIYDVIRLMRRANAVDHPRG